MVQAAKARGRPHDHRRRPDRLAPRAGRHARRHPRRRPERRGLDRRRPGAHRGARRRRRAGGGDARVGADPRGRADVAPRGHGRADQRPEARTPTVTLPAGRDLGAEPRDHSAPRTATCACAHDLPRFIRMMEDGHRHRRADRHDEVRARRDQRRAARVRRQARPQRRDRAGTGEDRGAVAPRRCGCVARAATASAATSRRRSSAGVSAPRRHASAMPIVGSGGAKRR